MSEYLYMTLRVNEITQDQLKAYMETYAERYGVKRVLMYDEIGDKNNKPHLQGVVGLVPIEDVKEQNKLIATMRKSLQSFFDRRGPRLSFKQVRDYTGYTAYIVKQGKQVLNIAYTPDEVREFEANAKVIQLDMAKNKKGTAKGTSTPMQIMYDHFEVWYLSEYEQYQKTHIHASHAKYLTDSRIARFVIKYYGEMAHKSFMKKKMAEAANYLKYRALQKFDSYIHESYLEATSGQVVELMGMW